jgi:hypothetical protein
MTTLAGEYSHGYDMDGVSSMLKTGIIDIHDRRIDTVTCSEMRTVLFGDIKVLFNRQRHRSGLGHPIPADVDTAKAALRISAWGWVEE